MTRRTKTTPSTKASTRKNGSSSAKGRTGWWARRRGTVAKPQASARTRRLRHLALWTALVLALAGGLVFLFFYSAAFVVKDVRVEGVEGEVATSVLHRAAIPHGRPLARVSEERVRQRVLEDLRVGAVEIDRDWPSTVTVVASAREPALVLQRGSGQFHADATGVVFEEVESPSNRLPVVRTQTDPEELDRQTVAGLVELWRLRPDPDELRGELDTPTLRRNGEVRFDIGVVSVLWGPPTEAEKKWKVLEALLAQDTIDPQGAIPMTIDVRTPDTPVVTGLPPAQDG